MSAAAAAAEVGALEATGLQLHEQIRFAGDRRWWTIRAVDDAHAVVTRQAAFEPRGVVVYTIVAHGQASAALQQPRRRMDLRADRP